MKRRLLLASFAVAAVLLYLLLQTPVPHPMSTSSNAEPQLAFERHVPMVEESVRDRSESTKASTPPEPQDTPDSEQVAEADAATKPSEKTPTETESPDAVDTPTEVAKTSETTEPPTEKEPLRKEPSTKTISPVMQPPTTETVEASSTERESTETESWVADLEKLFDTPLTAPDTSPAVAKKQSDPPQKTTATDELEEPRDTRPERVVRATPATSEKQEAPPSPTDNLESLFGAKPESESKPKPQQSNKDALVDSLAAMFPEPERDLEPTKAGPREEHPVPAPEPNPTPAASPASALPVAKQRDVNTPTTPTTPTAQLPPEWHAERREMRALTQQEGAEKLSAIFRLEPQDVETLSGVLTQYGMEALIAVPTQRVYFTIPYRQSLGQERLIESGSELSRRFGLSVNHLSLPWLENLRREYVANRLVPLALVKASLLVPTTEAEVILGRIVDGCRDMGYALDDVQACYGTFVRSDLSTGSVYHYELTRLILRDGREVRPTATPTNNFASPRSTTL
jgi:hypothetical protein